MTSSVVPGPVMLGVTAVCVSDSECWRIERLGKSESDGRSRGPGHGPSLNNNGLDASRRRIGSKEEESTSRNKSTILWVSFWNHWKMKAVLVAVIIASLGATAACLFRNPTIFMYPLHASCNITWTFKANCNDVSKRLLNQIEVWKTDATCGSGQKCLYALESFNGNVLKATHTTPVRRYVDDLTFTFYPNSATGGCNVLGFSTSRIWYAVLDYGTNYCNLHNLVDGAGLRGDELYSELTRDEICTQYTSSNCEKY